MKKRGFGSPNYNKDRQKEIASSGGRAAHAAGTAHRWASEEARVAALKARRKKS